MDSLVVVMIFSLVGESGVNQPIHFVSMINCDPTLTLSSIFSQLPYDWVVSIALTPHFLRLANSASRSLLSLNARLLLIMAPSKMTFMPVIFAVEMGNGQ